MNGRNLEASLDMAAGAFHRERIDRFGVLAVILAAVGVALQALALGHLPVISLFLATTFWVYGLIRRQVVTDAQAGLSSNAWADRGSGMPTAPGWPTPAVAWPLAGRIGSPGLRRTGDRRPPGPVRLDRAACPSPPSASCSSSV